MRNGPPVASRSQRPTLRLTRKFDSKSALATTTLERVDQGLLRDPLSLKFEQRFRELEGCQRWFEGEATGGLLSRID